MKEVEITSKKSQLLKGPWSKYHNLMSKWHCAWQKTRKAAGSSEVTTEMFTSAGDVGLDMLVSVYQGIMRDDSAPEGWHENVTIPLSKTKDTH